MGESYEIGPDEDLMREHGVLRRVLLVFDEAERRLRAEAELPPDVVRPAATLIRLFIQDFHERLEERYIFPLFTHDPALSRLTKILDHQHDAGRRVIDRIFALTRKDGAGNRKKRRELADNLHAFTRMYRPHASREDTVLFPAVHELIDPIHYRAMGERFRAVEERLFGGDAFQQAVGEVGEIERLLGIHNLSQFTPT